MSKKPIALEERGLDGARMTSPSAGRNLPFILEAFKELGLAHGEVLEIGCGTGEHAAHLVSANEGLHWLATDLDEASRLSCAAWADHLDVANRLKVEAINAAHPDDFDAPVPLNLVYSSNVIHISPLEVLEGILEMARKFVVPGGALALYGPFSRDGEHIAQSNAEFDANLKSRNPEWGVRDLDHDVVPRAEKSRLVLETVRPMPANNFFVVFRREA